MSCLSAERSQIIIIAVVAVVITAVRKIPTTEESDKRKSVCPFEVILRHCLISLTGSPDSLGDVPLFDFAVYY